MTDGYSVKLNFTELNCRVIIAGVHVKESFIRCFVSHVGKYADDIACMHVYVGRNVLSYYADTIFPKYENTLMFK